MSLYFILGDDLYAREQQIQSLIQTHLEAEWRELNLERHKDPAQISSVVDGWLTPPMWGERRVIVAEVQGEILQELLEALATHLDADSGALPETPNVLMIAAPTLDKRRKAGKALAKLAEIFEFQEVKRWNALQVLGPWVQKQVRAAGKQIDAPALEYLVSASGADRYLLAQNLEKVLIYLDTQQRIGLAEVQQMVMPTETDIFLLLEYLAKRDLAAVFQQLQTLLLHEHPNKLMRTLSTSLQRLYRSRWYAQQGDSEQQIAKNLGMHPYVVKMDMQRWRSFSLTQLQQAMTLLLDLQTRTRSSRLKPELALEMWLGQMLKL